MNPEDFYSSAPPPPNAGSLTSPRYVAPTIPEDRAAATLFGDSTKTTPVQQQPTGGPGALFYDAPALKPTVTPPSKPAAPAPVDPHATALYGADGPETYSFTLPVGFEHLVPDAAKHSAFLNHCRENRLSLTQAQELVNLHIRATYKPKG